jgi:hypothetical protein
MWLDAVMCEDTSPLVQLLCDHVEVEWLPSGSRRGTPGRPPRLGPLKTDAPLPKRAQACRPMRRRYGFYLWAFPLTQKFLVPYGH